MSKLPASRRVEIDGIEMVALKLPAYQQLRGYRSQVGTRGVRLRELRHELEVLTAYLADLTRRAQELPTCPDCPGQGCLSADLDCPRRLLLAALAHRPPRTHR